MTEKAICGAKLVEKIRTDREPYGDVAIESEWSEYGNCRGGMMSMFLEKRWSLK